MTVVMPDRCSACECKRTRYHVCAPGDSDGKKWIGTGKRTWLAGRVAYDAQRMCIRVRCVARNRYSERTVQEVCCGEDVYEYYVHVIEGQ